MMKVTIYQIEAGISGAKIKIPSKMSFLLDNTYIIADSKSDRFIDLQKEIDLIKIISKNIDYVYKYTASNIDNETYNKYYDPNQSNKLDYREKFSLRSFAVVLNHLECFSLISKSDPYGWSIICEDDVLIPNKEGFVDQTQSIFEDKPSDSDIIWISSGKKKLDCTYRNITGKDPDPSLNYDHRLRFCKIPESRYADCVMLKNSLVTKLLNQVAQFKISYPIDWEYNFWFKNNPDISSYWLQPAIVRQNPKFMVK